jgi:hypothetical protein
MTTPRISILRSGEMLPHKDGAGGRLCREEDREDWDERDEELRVGCAALERPPRREEVLLEEDLERVIGMTKSLYC